MTMCCISLCFMMHYQVTCSLLTNCNGLLQVMSSIDELHTFLGRDCLPSELGGLLQYDHDAWYHRCKVNSCCQCLLFMLMWSSALVSLLFSETVSNLVAYFLLGHPLYYHIRASLHLALYYVIYHVY